MTFLTSFQQQTATGRDDLRHYLPVLFGWAAAYPRVHVIEIGVDIGNSTTAFLAAASVVWGHVWSADINPDCEFYTRHGQERPDLWTFVPGNSVDPLVLARMPSECDVLFVDSSHLYDQTCAEIEAYLPRVRPGGVALFHDTNKPGSADRVQEALDDTLPGMGLSWDEYPGACGLGVVRVPAAQQAS